MKLLELQPEIAPGAPPQPPEETPEHAGGEPEARTCRSCGATMSPGQDWCLACGTAAGTLRDRPGARASLTVLGLTLVLVAGAVGASYAALRQDRTAPAQPAAQSQVAQAPPAATTPPPAATTPPPPATTTTPAPGTGTSGSKLPKVKVPTTSTPTPTPAPAPTPPPTATSRTTPPPAAPAPAPTTPSTGGGSQTTPGSGTTTPKPAAPVAIDLAASAATVYDPYRRVTAVGDVGKALDGDGGTSWFAEVPAGSQQINLGYAVNLGQARGVKSIDITTPTPGFRVEIYATDEATPPPTILDTRWAHITDKGDVGSDGKTHIVLGAGSSKYQTLLLWITQPPSDGTRVRISELKVFG